MKKYREYIVAWMTGMLTVSALSAIYVECYVHGDDINFVSMFFLFVAGILVAFIPGIFYTAFIAGLAGYIRRRKRPAWILIVTSTIISSLLFIGLASIFPKPIPDHLKYFNPPVPDVTRPAIDLNETPLLIATIVAGLLITRICFSAFRDDHEVLSAQLRAAAGANNSAH